MKILWVSPFLPYATAPHAGGRAIFQWLSRLGRRHEITLVCRMTGEERQAMRALAPLCRSIHAFRFDLPPPGWRATPAIAASYLRLGRVANALVRRESFDLLHVEYVETGVSINARLPVPRVLVAHDEVTAPVRRRLALARGTAARAARRAYLLAVRHLEWRVCRKFDLILAVSDVDRRRLLEIDPRFPVRVLPFPFGIDPSDRAEPAREGTDLLFVGAMHRDANADAILHFCREILPRIRQDVPGVRLTIVGNNPGADVVRLASDPGIRVTGFVAALEPYYMSASVFVSPVRIGGGIIVKNLDAMAAGCPVVTTSIGNEGIAATPGEHLLTADDPVTFAREVSGLLRDREKWKRLSDNARVFAHTRFSLDASVRCLEEVHSEVALTRRSPG